MNWPPRSELRLHNVVVKCSTCVQTILCFLWLTVFSPNANTYPLGSHLTIRNLPHSQKASRNDFHGPLGQALPRPSRVSLARRVLSCAHYFQAPATQDATGQTADFSMFVWYQIATRVTHRTNIQQRQHRDFQQTHRQSHPHLTGRPGYETSKQIVTGTLLLRESQTAFRDPETRNHKIGDYNRCTRQSRKPTLREN